MIDFRQLTKELTEIMDDIDETYRQIGLTNSEQRKSQLRRHIKNQQAKIRRLEKGANDE